MVKFSLNPRRFDPYKNFKFRLVGFAALGAVAGLVLSRILNGPRKEDSDA